MDPTNQIEEQIVPMDILSKRLRERAEQLGISNAEAARRVGLDERRYAHYVAGRREPDLGKNSVVTGNNTELAAGRYRIR
ncbi:helix-turn-helix domain-containing protein [Rhizobium laguerreae]|uniref:helix-turn-helix domain-containing protein n=1 Tax=Rhizobium laguerreae TaxID=1076926 RepID=UPI0028AE9877|nr:helix-turn-helix transcriptional regulator [Rhizobium laguerreae]